MNPAFIAFFAIIIAVVCIILAFRFGKVFFKFLSFFFFLFIIFLVVFGSFVVNDAVNFKEGITKGSSLFLLKDDDNLLAGVILKPVYQRTGADIYEQRLINASTKDIIDKGGLTIREDEEGSDMPFKFPEEAVLNRYKSRYAEEDLDKIASSYYKLFIFDISIFEGKEDEVLSLGDIELTVGEALEVLRTDDPLNSLAWKVSRDGEFTPDAIKEVINENFDADIRGVLFAMALGTVIDNLGDLTPIIGFFRSKQVDVYPSSLIFNTLSATPDAIVKVAMQKVMGGVEE
ncbi:hypothetical protein HQ533_04600 [Candidatus Woesearchaeota archaeon]|nr:hypothetical protein [Candidatus Woesearchaeota archaeon]